MVLVLGLTVFVDLITAVAVGVVLAALAFAKKMADEQLTAFQQELPRTTTPEERELLEAGDGRVTLFDFNGPLSFGAAADLGHHVRERVKARASAIVLDFSGTNGIDVSAARAVETIACDARLAGRTVYVCGMNPEVRSVLMALNADHCLPPDAYYDNRLDALRAAVATAVPGKHDLMRAPAAG